MMSMGPLGPPLGLAADVMGHGWLGLELGFGLLTLFEEWSRSEIFHPDRRILYDTHPVLFGAVRGGRVGTEQKPDRELSDLH